MNRQTAVRNLLEERADTTLFGPPPGHGRAIWALVATITVTLAVLQFWQLGVSVAALAAAALLLVAAGAALLPAAEPDGYRLPRHWAWGAVVAVTLVQLTTIWDAADGRGEGYAPWYIRGSTIICAAVILRRRAGAGWAGALVGYLILALHGAMTGVPVGEWTTLILRQAGALIAIQVFAVLLDRSRRAVAVLREEERARLAAIRLRDAATRQRQVEAKRIRGLVTPTLLRITAGEASAELRREAMLLEGALRDSLRGRRIAAGPVSAAARGARTRGVDVVLLDDLGEGAGLTRFAVPDAVLDWVATRLSTAEPPRATVRISATTDERMTVTFYSENRGEGPELLIVDPEISS
ncbi:MAG TPA: hypothetical protein PK781_11535 [Terrimesophilobacter sp.]|nr:hypothetical protein [Terrimesophilobacter sp.]